ncbi:MAG: glycosyltransferase family 4 protein [Hyphomicrobiales bacterium]|nr:glycosyltransferase family 4 protein [Hyphomicrobiales bacterium]
MDSPGRHGVFRVADLRTAAVAINAAPPLAVSRPVLKIMHVLRAPLGGLFRHVLDVARGQAARGHHVGLVVDSTTGGARADAALAELSSELTLGLERVPIARELGPSDVTALRAITRRIAQMQPDVLHGHGAKGAALVRLARTAPTAIRVITPHGGSLFYRPGTLTGGFYRSLEWVLKWRTDLFLFESVYVAGLFRTAIGRPPAMVRVVHNGVSEDEFTPIAPAADATDLVCLGELRPVKAFDVLIEALALLKESGRLVSLTIAGEGPLDHELKSLAKWLGVDDRVRFVGYRPAREAFAMGRMLVMPSHTESLPYVLLEAAAGGLPILASQVGGIPEIFGSLSTGLVPANNPAALATAIASAIDEPDTIKHAAERVRERVHAEFSLDAMVDGGLAAYREALALRKLSQFC